MVTIICIVCGTSKEVKNYRKNIAKYCSRKCKDKNAFIGQDQSKINKDNPRDKCKNCGGFIGKTIHICLKGAHGIGWKDDEVGYTALHTWIRRVLGKAMRCDYKNCIYPRKNSHGIIYDFPKAFHWANISHEYKRDLSDWIQLCVSCHSLYDHGKLKL